MDMYNDQFGYFSRKYFDLQQGCQDVSMLVSFMTLCNTQSTFVDAHTQIHKLCMHDIGMMELQWKNGKYLTLLNAVLLYKSIQCRWVLLN